MKMVQFIQYISGVWSFFHMIAGVGYVEDAGINMLHTIL